MRPNGCVRLGHVTHRQTDRKTDTRVPPGQLDYKRALNLRTANRWPGLYPIAVHIKSNLSSLLDTGSDCCFAVPVSRTRISFLFVFFAVQRLPFYLDRVRASILLRIKLALLLCKSLHLFPLLPTFLSLPLLLNVVPLYFVAVTLLFHFVFVPLSFSLSLPLSFCLTSRRFSSFFTFVSPQHSLRSHQST